jgi:hypothetical protein
MSDDDDPYIPATAAFLMVGGLIEVLRGRGVLSPQDVGLVFDSAVFAVEQRDPQDARTERLRQLLERLATKLSVS